MDDYKGFLSDIAKIQVGYQARGRIEENLDGNYTIVRSQDFNDDGWLMLDQAMRFYPPPIIDPVNYLILAGDILVRARGQSHFAYFVEEVPENTVAANTFYIVRIKDGATVFPDYLAWWINQPKVQTYFEQEQGVSTIPFISKHVLSKASVIIPPLQIQEKISDLNALWQQEQKLLQRLTQTKDSLIQAVARKAVEQSMEDSLW